MDYEQIERDFVSRTLDNLAACNRRQDLEHNATNLICQCLGLIVFPRSKDSTLGLGISLKDSNCKYGTIDKCEKGHADNSMEDAFLRHLRNSFAHGRFKVHDVDEKNNITKLQFTDKKDDKETVDNFVFVITVEELEVLAKDIANKYLESQKSSKP